MFRLDGEIQARETPSVPAPKKKNLARDAAYVHGGPIGVHSGDGLFEEEPESGVPMDYGGQPQRQLQVNRSRQDPATECVCCKKTGHRLAQCEPFYMMTPTQRRSFAAANRICYTCLDTGHLSQGCPNGRFRCGICDGRHHLLLHPAAEHNQCHQEEEYEDDDLMQFQVQDTQYLSCGYQHAVNTQEPLQLDVALTYCTVMLRNPVTHQEVKVNLLADTGANTSCIDSALGRELGLHGERQPYHVQVGGGEVHSYSSFQAEVEIRGIQPQAEAFAINLHVYKQPCGRLGKLTGLSTRGDGSIWPPWTSRKRQIGRFKA